MTTETVSEHAPEKKASLLYQMTYGNRPRRRYSPEHTRLSLMLLVSMVAAGVSTYLLSTMEGTSTPRFVMACVVAGWLSMIVHLFRGISSTTRS